MVILKNHATETVRKSLKIEMSNAVGKAVGEEFEKWKKFVKDTT